MKHLVIALLAFSVISCDCTEIEKMYKLQGAIYLENICQINQAIFLDFSSQQDCNAKATFIQKNGQINHYIINKDVLYDYLLNKYDRGDTIRVLNCNPQEIEIKEKKIDYNYVPDVLVQDSL